MYCFEIIAFLIWRYMSKFTQDIYQLGLLPQRYKTPVNFMERIPNNTERVKILHVYGNIMYFGKTCRIS